MSGRNARDLEFANFFWPPRWNNSRGPVAALTDCGTGADGKSKSLVAVTGPFGTVFIEREDLPYLIKHTEAMLDLCRKELE